MNNRNFAHRPEPVPFRDEHGRNCLRVPLDKHGRNHALVAAADYERVQRSGARGSWLLNECGGGRSYVRVSAPRRRGGLSLLMPARIIVGAGPKTVVRYVNGNPLDLRPENLSWHRGWAKRCDEEAAARGLERPEEMGVEGVAAEEVAR